MKKNTIKSLAATTAITLATVGTPALAEEVASTVETTNDTVVSTTEAPKADAPKTSSDVKPALDAQTQVVSDTQAEVKAAQDAATTADQAVTDAQSAVDTATQAVKDAEANVANATPENIAANQAEQAANLADQQANAQDTENVNAQITTQTQTVSDAQTAVDTAQAEKDQADATVASKEADVTSAQAAIDGSGAAQAQANLNKAKSDVETVKTNVDKAKNAVDTAKKADADRDAKIKAAETDVKVKSDAVKTATDTLTKAQDAVKTTTDTLAKANDVVKKAQDALKNVDVVKIADGKQFIENRKTGDSDFMTGSGATIIENSSTKIGEDDKTKIVDFTNITEAQAQELALYNLQVINAIRKQLGLPEFELNTGSMKAAQDQMNKYVARNKNILTNGHLPGDYFGENGGPIALAKYGPSITMYDAKKNIYDIVMTQAFADAPSKWGHSNNIQKQVSDFGASFGIIAGELYAINVFGIYTGTPITNPNDPAKLQAALVKAQADQTQAQTVSDNAKAKLTKASSDYATALEAKTQAEKALADATATPLQTQVAENNLRLATIALQNAEVRKAEAQKAVDNFSADMKTKQNQLADAKDALSRAKAEQAVALKALFAAQTELAKQQGVLDSLNKEKAELLAEKDRLVKEAKALATELKGYLEAPAILENAKADLTAKEATLKDTIAKAEIAHNALKDLSTKLTEEESKLAELQTEYDRLKDLEDKAKDNKVITLPDGSVIAVPKVAPIAEDLPVADPALLVSKPKNKQTSTPTVVEFADKFTIETKKDSKTSTIKASVLPNTGESQSTIGLFGLVGVVLGLGFAARKRKEEN